VYLLGFLYLILKAVPGGTDGRTHIINAGGGCIKMSKFVSPERYGFLQYRLCHPLWWVRQTFCIL
jgi:hypothetical protein